MDCARVRELISQYVEKDLAPQDQGPVEGHLRVCDACSSEVAAFRNMLSELKGLPQPQVPADFRESVWKRAEASGLRRAPSPSPAPVGPKPKTESRLRRWILEPWYLKLPVGALATAAVALLVVQVSKETTPLMTQPTKMKYSLDKGRLGQEQKAVTNLNGALSPNEESRSAFFKRERSVSETRPQQDINAEATSVASSDSFGGGLEPVSRRAGIPVGSVPQEKAAELSTEFFEDEEVEGFRAEVAVSIYHFRFPTADLAGTERQVAQILNDISSYGDQPMGQARPGPGRYYLTMNPAQFTLFMSELLKWDKSEVKLLDKLPPDFPAGDKLGYAVILDLVQ